MAAIQEKSTAYGDAWNWVCGNENPADLASRGQRADVLKSNQLWWEGPTRLKQNNWKWPIKKEETDEPEEVKEELRTHLARQEWEELKINHLQQQEKPEVKGASEAQEIGLNNSLVLRNGHYVSSINTTPFSKHQ